MHIISVIIVSSISGVFEFENEDKRVYNNDKVLNINVVRTKGISGTVSVTLEIVAGGNAIQDQDYELAETSIQFNDKQVYQIF